MLLPVLQVLFALVALACVVLAEPQNADVNPPATRPRNPGRVRPDRLNNPKLVNADNRPRGRPAISPNPERPVLRRPGVRPNFGPGAVRRPVPTPAVQPVVGPPAVQPVVAPPAVQPVVAPPAVQPVGAPPAVAPVAAVPAVPVAAA